MKVKEAKSSQKWKWKSLWFYWCACHNDLTRISSGNSDSACVIYYYIYKEARNIKNRKKIISESLCKVSGFGETWHCRCFFFFFFFLESNYCPSGQSPMSDLTLHKLPKAPNAIYLTPGDCSLHCWRHTRGDSSPTQPGTETPFGNTSIRRAG